MASSSRPTRRWRRPRAAERRSVALCGSGRVAAPIPSGCCGARGTQREEKERHRVFVSKQVRAGLVEPGPKRTLVRAHGIEDSCLCPRRVRRSSRERKQVSAATENHAADRRQEGMFFLAGQGGVRARERAQVEREQGLKETGMRRYAKCENRDMPGLHAVDCVVAPGVGGLRSPTARGAENARASREGKAAGVECCYLLYPCGRVATATAEHGEKRASRGQSVLLVGFCFVLGTVRGRRDRGGRYV